MLYVRWADLVTIPLETGAEIIQAISIEFFTMIREPTHCDKVLV